jgi:hypothetical protein
MTDSAHFTVMANHLVLGLILVIMILGGPNPFF